MNSSASRAWLSSSISMKRGESTSSRSADRGEISILSAEMWPSLSESSQSKIYENAANLRYSTIFLVEPQVCTVLESCYFFILLSTAADIFLKVLTMPTLYKWSLVPAPALGLYWLGARPTLGWKSCWPVSGSHKSLESVLEFASIIYDLSRLVLSPPFDIRS